MANRGFWVVLALLGGGCLPDNPSLDDEATSSEGGESETGEPPVAEGLLGCPAGEACTLVIVSQTIDDRVEVYSAAGPGPTYRGAIDVDLKPNLGGNIAGELLDEPYGLAFADQTLHVLLGHYPTRSEGSLLSLPAAGLIDVGAGELVGPLAWMASASVLPLERLEPLSIVARGEGLHVGVFANDLALPEDQWTNQSSLLAIDAQAGTIEPLALACAGAWTLARLDDAGDRLALACDGDEQIAVVAAEQPGGPLAPACTAAIPFTGKRVRYLAGDGLGGMLVAEHPTLPSTDESARLWWFDGACGLRGFTTLEGDISWTLHQLAALPSELGPRWWVARGDGEQRGVLMFAGDVASGEATQCSRLQTLDDEGAWLALGGSEPLRPHALAPASSGRALAIGAGPASYGDAAPGWGKVLWVELDDAEDPCEAEVVSFTELSASAPAVDPMVPQTWRRAPDVVLVVEVEP
jgi:hypothetical protein